MSAPVIWIFTPMLAGVIIFWFNRYRRISLAVGIVVMGLLAGLAWKLPIGVTFHIGSLSIRLSDSFALLGRHFTLGASSNGLLIFLYLMAGAWFIGALVIDVNRLFPSLALGIVSLLVAAVMFEPFLYAALLIEMAILLSLPLLVPPGTALGQGVVRYLIFQTLAMPFILFTGWMLTGLEAGISDPGLTLRAAILLGLGFAFLLAIFPFFSWVPLLTEQYEPYIAGFLLIMLQTVALLFAAKFIDQYTWLRDNPVLYQVLRIAGTLTMVTGGIMAAFQAHLGRIFGFAVIFETGISLLALSQIPEGGMGSFVLLFIPRMLTFILWGLCLSILKQECGGLDFRQIQRTGRSDPFLAGCAIFANLSMVGLPLFAAFPARLALWQTLIQQSPLSAIWGLISLIGLLASAIRAATALFEGEGWNVHGVVSWPQAFLLGISLLSILILGSQPQQIFLSAMNMANAYPHILP